ncbi:cytochrome P450 [Pseudomassariella vexata]|uniref:Cytochrome P450 n=1 Tax=Pseudomassariella vexata TaxID=1141098 RepID=A0A1Y2DGJ7_9PEZI|nr:cytochrome P450 [Pseudomassariella vexata]ORY58411.1 cytochrome P450 [Pseudomassariella vexata]
MPVAAPPEHQHHLNCPHRRRAVYASNTSSYCRRMKGAKPIPGPKCSYAPNLIPLFNRWNRTYGSIMAADVLGTKQVVLGTDKAANDLLVKRGNIYSGRGTPPAALFMSQGLVTFMMQKTEKWRRQRKLLHTLLASTVATKYEPFIELESTYSLRDLLQTPEAFENHVERYAYAIVFSLGLGKSITNVHDDVLRESSALTDEILATFRPEKYIANLIPILIRAPSWLVPSNGKLAEVQQRMKADVLRHENRVRKGVGDGTGPDSWMRYYLENRDEYGLELEEARSPYNVLLTVITIMMEYPEWQKKVQDEVDRVVGAERLPAFDDLPNLPVFRAVIKEGIRWRSIVAEIGVPHLLDEDDFYEGFFIPKGTMVYANYNLYPDGAVFNPDRWLNPAYPTYREPLIVYPNLLNFTSFGYGRRVCPGPNFTERTLTIMTARIAWACDIKKRIDPATKKEMPLNIRYEPTPNPKPLPFPSDIKPRNKKRTELVRKEAERRRATDPLAQ